MIKTLIFDIGNVLLFFSHEKMFQQIATISNLEAAQIQQELLTLGTLYEEGKITTEELYKHFSTLAKKPFSQEDFIYALTDIFQPNRTLFPYIEELQNRGIRLLLLSNICDAHYRHIVERYEVFKHFDYPILSYEVKARKPHEAIFKAALAAAHCQPEECFYTDDIEEFVTAARRLGIRAHPYTNPPAFLENLKQEGLLLF